MNTVATTFPRGTPSHFPARSVLRNGADVRPRTALELPSGMHMSTRCKSSDPICLANAGLPRPEYFESLLSVVNPGLASQMVSEALQFNTHRYQPLAPEKSFATVRPLYIRISYILSMCLQAGASSACACKQVHPQHGVASRCGYCGHTVLTQDGALRVGLWCSLARRGMKLPDADDPLAKKRLFYGNNGSLVVGILPVSIFASGHTFFVSRIYQQLQLDPYVVHATFQFSGTDGKRNRMREFELWKDEPEYYQPGHGFVTWEMDTPEHLVASAVPNPPSLECCTSQQGHFDLVNHQLVQTRNALAAASVCYYHV